MAQPVHFRATVEHVWHHTPDVASFRLRSDKRLPRFTPGQFIHLTLEDYDPAGFWPESRVFSVANSVADRRTVDLTVSRQGGYTSRMLDQLREGNSLWAKGPYGDFTVDDQHGYRCAVLIAGGTGITPFAAFMDAALAAQRLPVEETVLYYGAQTPDLLIYRPLAERCAHQLPGFRVSYFSEQVEEVDASGIRAGRLDVGRIMDDLESTADCAFFLSGPQPMINSFQYELMNRYGLPPQQVWIDAWE